MTGPEHYERAEELVKASSDPGFHPDAMTHLAAEAQVHATLALATAIVQHAFTSTDEWVRVTGARGMS